MSNNRIFKSLQVNYSIKEILDSLMGAFIYATLIYLPIILILIEIITVYLYLLTLFSFIIIIALFGYVFLIHHFWEKSLLIRNNQHNQNIKKLFLKNALIINSIILIIGVLVIYVLIPILFV